MAVEAVMWAVAGIVGVADCIGCVVVVVVVDGMVGNDEPYCCSMNDLNGYSMCWTTRSCPRRLLSSVLPTIVCRRLLLDDSMTFELDTLLFI